MNTPLCTQDGKTCWPCPVHHPEHYPPGRFPEAGRGEPLLEGAALDESYRLMNQAAPILPEGDDGEPECDGEMCGLCPTCADRYLARLTELQEQVKFWSEHAAKERLAKLAAGEALEKLPRYAMTVEHGIWCMEQHPDGKWLNRAAALASLRPLVPPSPDPPDGTR